MAEGAAPAVQPPNPPAIENNPNADEPGRGDGDPNRIASSFTILLFGIYLIVLSFVLFYFLLKLMPGIASDTGPATVNLIGWGKVLLWPETRLLLLAICAGALGSFVHTATSFADFVGNRQLVKSWLWWYLLRPFIGSFLAATLYVAIRAGLMPAQGASGMNAFGVATVSALSGMFAKQATDKLREVFENLFKSTPPPRADALKTTPASAAAAAAGKK